MLHPFSPTSRKKLILNLHEAMSAIAEKSGMQAIPRPFHLSDRDYLLSTDKAERKIWADAMIAAYWLTHQKHGYKPMMTTIDFCVAYTY